WRGHLLRGADARGGRLPVHARAGRPALHGGQPLEPALHADRRPLADARSQSGRAPVGTGPGARAEKARGPPPRHPPRGGAGPAPRDRRVVALRRLRRPPEAPAGARGARAARRLDVGVDARLGRRARGHGVKTLAVVVLSWNGLALTRDTLRSLGACRVPDG